MKLLDGNKVLSLSPLTIICCSCVHQQYSHEQAEEYKEGLHSSGSGSEGIWSTGYFFISPPKEKGFEKASEICRINKWLQNWCHSQGFFYLDHATHFEKCGLLEAGGVHLSEKKRKIFGRRLAKMVEEGFTLKFPGKENLNLSHS